MDNKAEIIIEIRDDVLKFIKAKAERHGYSVDELVENYLKMVVKLGRLPFDSEELAELSDGENSPLISAEELAANLDEALETLFNCNSAIHIWRECEIVAVMMTKDRYDGLIATVKKAGEKEVENGS